MTPVYVIGSSSLINLHRQIPRDAFSSVWGKVCCFVHQIPRAPR